MPCDTISFCSTDGIFIIESPDVSTCIKFCTIRTNIAEMRSLVSVPLHEVFGMLEAQANMPGWFCCLGFFGGFGFFFNRTALSVSLNVRLPMTLLWQ